MKNVKKIYIIISIIIVTMLFTFSSHFREIISLVLGAFIIIFIHEVGHIIGAKLGNIKYGTMYIGPLIINNFDGRYNVRFNWTPNILYFGACGNLSFNNDLKNLNKRYFLSAIFGPLISIVVGGILLFISNYLNIDYIRTLSYISLAIGVATCASDGVIGFKSLMDKKFAFNWLIRSNILSFGTTEVTKEYIEKIYANYEPMKGKYKDDLEIINAGLRYYLYGYIDSLNFDVYKIVDYLVNSYEKDNRKVYNADLYEILTNAIVYIIDKNNMDVAEKWYKVLNKMRIPKDIISQYELYKVKYFLDEVEINIPIVKLDNINKQYYFNEYYNKEKALLNKLTGL